MAKVQSKAAQDFVPIKEIRDGIAILKDNTLRAIVLASSINFSLKSEEERNAIIMQFQDFLNSLDFSIQIESGSTFFIGPFFCCNVHSIFFFEYFLTNNNFLTFKLFIMFLIKKKINKEELNLI